MFQVEVDAYSMIANHRSFTDLFVGNRQNKEGRALLFQGTTVVVLKLFPKILPHLA